MRSKGSGESLMLCCCISWTARGTVMEHIRGEKVRAIQVMPVFEVGDRF
jgi:hypothetical protein